MSEFNRGVGSLTIESLFSSVARSNSADDSLKRQEHGEHRPMVFGGLTGAEEERSTMADDDLFAHPKSQTGANRPLGGEEGLEEPLDRLLRDA